jgi:hypothetical protein
MPDVLGICFPCLLLLLLLLWRVSMHDVGNLLLLMPTTQ